jgi:O-antigen ligase
MGARSIRALAPLPGAVAIALCGAAAVPPIYLGHRYGPLAALASLLAEVLLPLLLAAGRLATILFIVTGIVAEEDPNWGFKPFADLYQHVPSAFEGLEALALVALLLHLVRTRQPLRTPRPFGGILLLVVGALIAGIAQGLFVGTGQRFAYVSIIQSIAPLLVVPLIVVNAVRTRQDFRFALRLGVALVGFKALAGLFVVLAKIAPTNPGIGRITYYQPTSNLFLMLFLLAMLVAGLSRTPVSRQAKWVLPLALLSVLLSYRRTIWLGTGAGALLLLFPASGRVGRRLLVPAICVLVVAGYLVLGTGVAGRLEGPLISRASSISLSKIEQSKQDRYRIGERKNVWTAIEREPITGIGLGTAWLTRYPMSFEYPDGHLYVHIAALWWWMKMGLLGLASYVLLIASAIFTGLRVWRRHSDRQIRVFGLSAAGMTVGLVVVELASTVIGPNERGTMLFGLVLGLLAAARSDLVRGEAGPASTAS